MSVVAIAVGGSALVGAYSAKQSRDSAEDMNNKALAANAWQGEIAKSQWDDYQKLYKPLEQKMVQEVERFDSQQAYDDAGSEAQATVNDQLAQAQARLSRQPGTADPSSPAAQAAQMRLALSGAAMGAGAANQARQQVRDKAWAHKMDMLGLGKGLVTNASNGLAANARTSAALAGMNNANANQTASAVGGMVQGLAQGINWSALGRMGGTPITPVAATPTMTMAEVGAQVPVDWSGLGI